MDTELSICDHDLRDTPLPGTIIFPQHDLWPLPPARSRTILGEVAAFGDRTGPAAAHFDKKNLAGFDQRGVLAAGGTREDHIAEKIAGEIMRGAHPVPRQTVLFDRMYLLVSFRKQIPHKSVNLLSTVKY